MKDFFKNTRLINQLCFAMWLVAGVIQLSIGNNLIGSLDLLLAALYFSRVYALSRVPGGIKIGRFELYVTSVHEKGPNSKFVQYDKCPGGCKLVSVGRIGATILGEQCYPNEEEE